MNVLYNLCIIICLIFVYFSIKNHNWAYALGGIFLGGMVVIFKLRLVKDVRNNINKKP